MTSAPEARHPQAGSAGPLPGGLAADIALLYAWPLGDDPAAGLPGPEYLAPPAGAPQPPQPPHPPPPPPPTRPTAQPSPRPARTPLPPARAGSLTAMAAALQAGTVTAADLLEQALERIIATDPDIDAWATIDERGARQQAAALDAERAAGRIRSPLHGIPAGIKDLIDVAGLPTGAGSRHFSDPGRGRAAVADGGSARRLRDAGMVIVGKTRTHEFAFGGTTPPVRNPLDHSRIPGGSSGGSAAAVAAGQVPFTLGTDTAGAVRIPSAYCGTAGLVPSPGLVPSTGVVPLAWTLDRVGLMTATAADLALAATALGVTGPAALSGEGALDGLRIGVPAGALDDPIDPEVRAAVQYSLDLAARHGAVLREVALPLVGTAIAAGMTIIVAESADYHHQRLAADPGLFGADVQATLALAGRLPAAAYVRAMRLRQLLRAELLAVLAEVDVLASPTLPCLAPRWSDVADDLVPVGGTRQDFARAHLRYTVGANLAGLPCASQPCAGQPAGELPAGLHWATAPGRDALLLRVMTAFEAAAADPAGN